MDRIFDIALIYTAHEWVEALHRYCMNTGNLRIRALVYDHAILATEEFDAVVVSDAFPALSSAFVSSLHARNKIVIAVCEESSDSRSFVAELGVDAVISNRDNASDLAEQIKALITTTQEANTISLDSRIIHLDKDEEKNDTEISAQRIISVVGTGGTGATECALALSTRLVDSLAIDMDFEHPSFAPRCSLPIEPHLLDSIEASQNAPDTFFDTVHHSGNVNVVIGTTHAAFARDIRPYEISALIDLCRNNYASTIIDLGRISADSSFHSVTETVLSHSDVVIVVSEPTPIGVLRALEITAHVDGACKEINASEPVILHVFNKCPTKKEMEVQVRQEIAMFERIKDSFFLPFDKKLQRDAWETYSGMPHIWKKSFDALLVTLETYSHAPLDRPEDNEGSPAPELDEVLA